MRLGKGVGVARSCVQKRQAANANQQVRYVYRRSIKGREIEKKRPFRAQPTEPECTQAAVKMLRKMPHAAVRQNETLGRSQ